MEQDEHCLQTKVKKFGNQVKEVRIHIDSNFLFEEEIAENKIIMKEDLSNLICILVKRKALGVSTLTLCFPHDINYKYKLQDKELDYLLSNIVHSLQTREEAESVPLILLEPAYLNSKIYGFSEGDSSYENSLIKELQEVTMGNYLESNTQFLLFDAAFNANFKSSGYDNKLVSLLFQFLAELSQVLCNLEAEPTAMKNYQDVLAFANKINSQGAISETGKILQTIYQRLPPLLAIIKNLMLWRVTLPEIGVFKSQASTLFSLTRSQDSIVSLSASLVLRSLFRVNNLI